MNNENSIVTIPEYQTKMDRSILLIYRIIGIIDVSRTEFPLVKNLLNCLLLHFQMSLRSLH